MGTGRFTEAGTCTAKRSGYHRSTEISRTVKKLWSSHHIMMSIQLGAKKKKKKSARYKNPEESPRIQKSIMIKDTCSGHISWV